MYARSTTFDGRPENIEAGIRFIEREAAPAFEKIDGCLGLSAIVDRTSGQCIATSAWETEEAMHAAAGEVRPIRDHGHSILGGSVEIDEWEIAAMHHGRHGECCRVSWLEGDLDEMIETFRVAILPRLEQTPGFCGASLLVNWSSGIGCSTTVWESRAAMEGSRTAADDMRQQTASAAGGEILEVHEYDLAYAHLHVPEMA